jgi:hypothetical protein
VVRRRALAVELERQLVALAPQPVDAALQPDAVGLEAMAQAGLGDAAAGLQVNCQAVKVVEQLGVEVRDVAGDDPA